MPQFNNTRYRSGSFLERTDKEQLADEVEAQFGRCRLEITFTISDRLHKALQKFTRTELEELISVIKEMRV
jgi:hypothetical protein